MSIPDWERAQDIIKKVAELGCITIDDMRGSSRKIEIVWPRQVAMAIIKGSTMLSLERIGELFGCRDHSTVINSITRIENCSGPLMTFYHVVYSALYDDGVLAKPILLPRCATCKWLGGAKDKYGTSTCSLVTHVSTTRGEAAFTIDSDSYYSELRVHPGKFGCILHEMQ